MANPNEEPECECLDCRCPDCKREWGADSTWSVCSSSKMYKGQVSIVRTCDECGDVSITTHVPREQRPEQWVKDAVKAERDAEAKRILMVRLEETRAELRSIGLD